jgi:hypothetical protein
MPCNLLSHVGRPPKQSKTKLAPLWSEETLKVQREDKQRLRELARSRYFDSDHGRSW